MISGDPDLIPRDALSGVTVGLSVSDSSDLARLGLDARHAELAIGEITRAILIAGGSIAYGGRLRPSGFTQQLMNEVRRFGVARHSITFYLALPEHQSMDRDELATIDRELGTWGRLVMLDYDGSPTSWKDVQPHPEPLAEDERATAYSGLRRCMSSNVNARILVGGQLRGYRGAMPGLVEEAILAVERGQPLYMAGGFGGAAAAAARHLGAGPFDWLPPGVPEGADDGSVRAALGQLGEAVANANWEIYNDALTPERRALLSASHRPGEIASLCVAGLATRFSEQDGEE